MTQLPYTRRVQGCLLAGAIGDALGSGLAKMPLAEIRARYGTKGRRPPDPGEPPELGITSITQGTLFTAEGLIRAWVRGETRGVGHPPATVAHAYRRLFFLQGVPWATLTDGYPARPDGWLVERPWLRFCSGDHPLFRAGGVITRAWLPREGRPRPALISTPDPDYACDPLLRIAPVGLLLHAGTGTESTTRQGIFRLATEIAALTHTHPDAQQPAALLATLLWGVVHAHESLEKSLTSALRLLEKGARPADAEPRADPRSAAERAIARALASISPKRHLTPEALDRLSPNRAPADLLATALAIALRYPKPSQLRAALHLATQHSGDSAAVAALTGHLLGALHGATTLPTSWLDQLAGAPDITTLASDFARQMTGTAPTALDAWSTFTPDWMSRYPPW